jgi:hypothetical protein
MARNYQDPPFTPIVSTLPAGHPRPNRDGLTLRRKILESDAMIMGHAASSRVRFAAPTGPGLELSWEGFRELGLWMKPGAPFLCIWMARQLTEAYGWEWTPKYIVRDRDSVYGKIFTRRLHAMGIRDRPTAPQSPWQNGHTERLIRSIRRECLDHVVIFGERHLRHTLLSNMHHYNSARTHLSRNKDAPLPRAVQAVGRILPTPILGGLHHRYVRI